MSTLFPDESKIVNVSNPTQYITYYEMRLDLQRDSGAVLLSKIVDVQKTVEISLLQIAVEHLLADLHHPLHVLLRHGGHMFQVRDGEESIILSSTTVNVVLLTTTSLQADQQTLGNIFTFQNISD